MSTDPTPLECIAPPENTSTASVANYRKTPELREKQRIARAALLGRINAGALR